MAQFYFHLRRKDEQYPDIEGRDLPSVRQIEQQCLREARAMIGHDASAGCIDLTYTIEVRDAANRVVHVLKFQDAVEIVGGHAGTGAPPTAGGRG